ncbi:MAG: hypothetical protein AAFU60_00040 [Bacteroidota bacterium]
MSTIRYIKRNQIDTLAWDRTVEQATLSLPYAYSWVLDLLCEEWDGLVKGDYEAVMPLPFNRKLLGFKQVYQPYYIQQLGVFSESMLSATDIQAFQLAIPGSFRKVHYPFNESNPPPALTERFNLVLDLQRSYEEIHQGYNRSGKRHLRKWKAEHRFSINELAVTDVTELYVEQLKQKVRLSAQVLQTWPQVMEKALLNGKGLVAAVHYGEELGAAGFFWTNQGRIINPFGASTDAGRDYQSMRVLLDALIEHHAQKATAFDFEGSSIPSIATFFQSFGPEKKPYPFYHRSSFPYSLLDRYRTSK